MRYTIALILYGEHTSIYNTATIWCSIIKNTGSLLVGVCYHITSTELESELLRTASTSYDSAAIVGDINHRAIDWSQSCKSLRTVGVSLKETKIKTPWQLLHIMKGYGKKCRTSIDNRTAT